MGTRKLRLRQLKPFVTFIVPLLLGIISVFSFLYYIYEFESNVAVEVRSLSLLQKNSLGPVDIFDPSLSLPQDDNLILKEILESNLLPPPANLQARKIMSFTQLNSTSVLKYIFKDKKPRFFVECGANDGEYLSTTLEWEMNYNWTGLLIEASPKYFYHLKETKRNAWISNSCLSDKPEKVEFIICMGRWHQGQGKIRPAASANISHTCSGQEYRTEKIVKCFPLFSILSAINVTYVDYFNLDVEGHEYKVLKAIPFDRLFIKVIQVEYWLTPEGKEAISDLLLSKGYKMIYDDPHIHHNFIFFKDE